MSGERRGGPGRGPGRRPAPRTLLYGRNPVHEALRAQRRPVRQIWATPGAAREPWLAGAHVRVELSDADRIAELCGSDAHQGVCADAGPYPYADPAALLARPGTLLVALDEVQDPQNLGAIARTAEAAGAQGLLIGERRSAEVTPAAAKASAGAVEHLPIARVRNLADALADAKAAGLWCYGAEAGAPTRYDQADYAGGAVLVLGAEGKGLRPRVRASCDVLVSLPQHGRMESLNVGAAAAVLLFEIARQRAG